MNDLDTRSTDIDPILSCGDSQTDHADNVELEPHWEELCDRATD